MADQTVLHTSNPVYDHKFSWTIENFSRTPDVLRGPAFSPIPGLSETFCFELKYTQPDRKHSFGCLCMDLIIDVKCHLLNIICDTKLCNTDDTILHHTTHRIMKIKVNACTSFSLMCITLKSFEFYKSDIFLNLLEDKLIVKGTLSFSGYDTVSNVCSPSVKISAVGHVELLKDLKSMYESTFAQDITFSVNGKSLRAHRAILCSRSLVFAKMFQHDMLERNSDSLVIEDTDFRAFNSFLLFLYTGVVEDKKCDTVLSLYSLADKYGVESLHKECSRMIGNSFANDSVCNVLVLSDLHGDDELKEAAKSFIRVNFTNIVKTNEWAEVVTTKPQLASEVLGSITSLPGVRDLFSLENSQTILNK